MLVSDNLFSPFISKQQYKPVWKQIIVKNNREKAGWPAKRGGHQICADHINGKCVAKCHHKCLLFSDF